MRIQRRIKRTVDGPIVRQTDFRPLRVIELGILCSFNVSFEKTPAIVETNPAFLVDLHLGRGDCRRGKRTVTCDEQTTDELSDHCLSYETCCLLAATSRPPASR